MNDNFRSPRRGVRRTRTKSLGLFLKTPKKVVKSTDEMDELLRSANYSHRNFLKKSDSFTKTIITNLMKKVVLTNRRRVKAEEPSRLPQLDYHGVEDKDTINVYRHPCAEMIWMTVVRTVVLLLTAFGAMVKPFKKFEKVTEKSIMNEYRTALNTLEMKALSFDHKNFITNKLTTVPETAARVMTMGESLRKPSDIMIIYSVMMNLPVFATKYTSEMCWKMARHCRYVKYAVRRVISKQNRTPIRVYFIYSGVVNVIYNMGDDEDLYTSHQKKVVSLTRGACIGHTHKTQLCICATECELLVINKDVYEEKGFNEIQEKEFEDKFEFFRRWPPLEGWSDGACYDIAKVSFVENYPCDRMILRDITDDVSDLAWFVVRGAVEVVKVVEYARCHGVPKQSLRVTPVKEKMTHFKNTTLKRIQTKSYFTPTACLSTHRSSVKSDDGLSLLAKSSLAQESHSLKKPMYLKIRTLNKGDCYGIGKLKLADLPQDSNRFCLISKDSTVIRTPCTELCNLIGILGVDHKALLRACFVYDSDETICQKMIDILTFDRYKNKILKSLKTPGHSIPEHCQTMYDPLQAKISEETTYENL